MRRRDVIAVLGGAAFVWPGRARADVVRTVGILMQGSDTNARTARLFDVLRRSLADLGWREGANLQIELRWTHDDTARARTYAQELVSLKPDVIVAPATSLTPVREATRSIPIVFLLIVDPVGQGVVPSLAHPGGNLTGFAYMDFSTGGKLVQLLKEIAPDTKRLLVLLDADNAATPQWWRSIEDSARIFGYEPQRAVVRSEDEIDAAIAAFAQAQNGGIIVPGQSLFVSRAARLTAAAARERLPAVYGATPLATAGSLMSYAVDAADQFVHAAAYVDRILKGDQAGDLPVQQPTKFELIINLKTAKALGLEISPNLLAQADEVME
jgi:putative tryptophan/tyrosine transport system substrate-binding protein